MLGVGGLSFSRGMGVSMLILGLTERAGSRYDSLNFPFTLVPLGGKKREEKKCIKTYILDILQRITFIRVLTCKL